MKFVYVDDVAYHEEVVKEASRIIARWLGQNVGFEFITCNYHTADPLWLQRGAECAERDMDPQLHGAKCVPSKKAIDATLNGRDTWYLLDLEFHPNLMDYGLDLALYLVAKGVSPERILIFSAFPERVFGRFTDELEKHTRMALPPFHSYRKDALEAGGEGLAWRIMQIRGWEVISRGGMAAQSKMPKGIVGQSKELREAVCTCLRAAKASKAPILIEGETGTGKELMAKMIHEESDRSDHPFVAINSAAIPKELIESELFGHVRGAFTGAAGERVGKFELAQGGVLFLDEIGDLSEAAQAKLLRVLQEKEVCRLGSNTTRKIDVRVIAATHRNLKQMIQQGKFRKDLYFRLAVICVTLPPLRQRCEDIVPLAEHFLRDLRRENPDIVPNSLHPQAAALLEQAYWDGNARELKNVIERLAVFGESRMISAESVKEALVGIEQIPDQSVLEGQARTREVRLKRATIPKEWLDAVAQLKARTDVTNFLTALRNVLDQVPKDGIDPKSEAVIAIWNTLVAANKQMCLYEKPIRTSRSEGDGDYGLGIFKVATLLSCLNLSQSERDVLAREVGRDLPDWSIFQFNGKDGNPRNWPQERRDKVAGIIRAMANINQGK